MRVWIFVGVTVLLRGVVGLAGGASQPPTLVFPQIANGGGVFSEIILTNPGSAQDQGTVEFFDGEGKPWALEIAGVSQSSVAYSVPPAGALKIVTGGSGPVLAGYALVHSENSLSSVAGVVIYRLGDFEVSVASSPQSRTYHVFAERSADDNSGIALVNPNEIAISIQAYLRERNGEDLAQQTIDLGAGEQTARFVDQIFGDVGTALRGSVHLVSEDEFAVTGLRQRSNGSLATLNATPTAFPADVAVIQTGDSQFGVIAVHLNGEKMVATTTSDGEGRIGTVTGALWVDVSGIQWALHLDSEGRPDRFLSEDYVVLFGNQTTDTVDVAVIRPDGNIEVFPSVHFGAGGLRANSVPVQADQSGLSKGEVARIAGAAVATFICGINVLRESVSPVDMACSASRLVNPGSIVLANDPALEGSSVEFGLIACGSGSSADCLPPSLEEADAASAALAAAEDSKADLIVEAREILGGSALSPGSVYSVDSILGNLRFVPKGAFTQGSTGGELCRDSDEEQFSHTLTRNLAVMETEVTHQMWNDLRVLQPTLVTDPGSSSDPDLPVNQVMWYEALLFANLLSVQTGLERVYYIDAGLTVPLDVSNYMTDAVFAKWGATGYRLPSEGEWEYFARAGTDGPFSLEEPNYTLGVCLVAQVRCGAVTTLTELGQAAWFCPNSGFEIHATGQKLSSPWGLKDVHGNLFEWTWDWYGSYPEGAQTNYEGPASGDFRVIRGGSYNSIAAWLRSGNRDLRRPTLRGPIVGFRLVRTVN